MEKSCEGTRGGGGGNSSASRSSSSGFTSNTTRRPYNMLSSIINLSSSTTTAASNTSSSVAGTAVLKTARESVPCSSPSKTPNKSYAGGNHHHQHQKISPDEPKKKKNHHQYTSTSPMKSSPKSPTGPAPKTLSILTALNELAINDRSGAQRAIPPRIPPSIQYRSPISLPTSVNPNHSPSTGKNVGALDDDSNGPIYSSPTSVRNSRISSSGSCNNNNNNGNIASTPRRPKALDKNNTRLGRSIGSISSLVNRSKSKERTPDWIWKIFQLAKHGKLEELQQSLKSLEPMDPTMLRHLVDGKGNTLLHCAARAGHVLILQWLVSILGPHTEAVLNDKNRAGRNVILTALKGGQLKCFQWLVLQSVSGDKGLVPKEGERSLLHFAANYGNEPAVRWLIEQMTKRNVGVDIKDSSGFTPLHMAAKTGSVSVCHTLITLAGTDPYAETELGWRPSDLALRHRHIECANYLIMTEAASSLGSELYHLISAYKNLREEHEFLRQHFREVLRVGKSLVKERVDLIKSFPSSSSSSSAAGSSLTPSSEAALLLLGTGNNGARFSGLEHKLVKAEQAWKRMEVQVVDKFPTIRKSTSTGAAAAAAVTTSSPSSSAAAAGPNSGSNSGTRCGISAATSVPGGNETTPAMVDVDFMLENINSPNILQKRLAGLQSRRDKNFTSEAFLSASSSDNAESSASTTSSSSEADDDDEEDDDDDRMHNRRHQRQQHYPQFASRISRSKHPIGQLPTCITSSSPTSSPAATTSTTAAAGSSTPNTSNRSGNAPWLLPPDDHLLAALSPIVSSTPKSNNKSPPNLDLLRITSPKNPTKAYPPPPPVHYKLDVGNISQVSLSPGSLDHPSVRGTENKESSSTTAGGEAAEIAVLEVIEPGSKGSYFTPDLLRRHHHSHHNNNNNEGGKGNSIISSPSPVYSSTSHSGLEEIYGEIKGIPNGHHSHHHHRSSNASAGSCDEQQKIETKTRNSGGAGGGIMTNMLSAPLSQSTRVSLTATYVTLPRAASDSGGGGGSGGGRYSTTTTKRPHHPSSLINSSDGGHERRKNLATSFNSWENLRGYEQHKSGGSLILSNYKCTKYLNNVQVPSAGGMKKDAMVKGDESEEIAVEDVMTDSAAVTNASSALPVIKRTPSSASTAVLFPTSKALWTYSSGGGRDEDVEELGISVDDDNGTTTGRVSPSSEVSKTESALVRPPLSFTSSQVSASTTATSEPKKYDKEVADDDDGDGVRRKKSSSGSSENTTITVFLNDSNYSTAANDQSGRMESCARMKGIPVVMKNEEEGGKVQDSILFVVSGDIRSRPKEEEEEEEEEEPESQSTCMNDNAAEENNGSRMVSMAAMGGAGAATVTEKVNDPTTATAGNNCVDGGGGAAENVGNIRLGSSVGIVRSGGGRHHHHHHHHHGGTGGGMSGHQKSGIQRSTKNRGPAKPWYEIEGSDDEEGSLLSVVKKRSRSGSHSSSSRVNNSNVSTRHLASSLSSEETTSEGQEEDGEEEEEEQNGENRENEGSFPKAHFL